MRTENRKMPVDMRDSESCWRRIGVEGDRSCPRLAQSVHCRNCPVFSAAGQELLQCETPPEYLDYSTRQLANVEEGAATETFSLLIFRVGSEWLSLDARTIVEVVDPRPIHRIPHRTNRLLLGLANIRGELHLCLSLRELLDIDPTKSDATSGYASPMRSRQRLLVAEHGQERWVFPVDEVEGVHHVPAGAMESLPHTVQKSPRYYSQAIFSHDNKRVGMLSVSRLFQALQRTVQ